MKFKKAVLINIADTHFDKKYWDQIDELVETRISLSRDDPKLFDELKDCDVLMLGFQVPVAKDIFDAAPNLKLVNVLATAFGTVDIEEASKRDIPVCNLVGYSTEAVAEFTITALLAEIRGIPEGLKRAEADNYDFTGIRARELKGSNFGVIGLGNIGNRVAELAAGFGANVHYWSHSKKDSQFKAVELDELLKTCDFISVNVAETEDTIGLLNTENIPLIPKGGVLVSTVPPSVTDIDALVARLAKDDMSFVIVNHPYPTLETELAKLKDFSNATIYPAIGFITDEARIAKQEVFVANLNSYLNGQIQNKVY